MLSRAHPYRVYYFLPLRTLSYLISHFSSANSPRRGSPQTQSPSPPAEYTGFQKAFTPYVQSNYPKHFISPPPRYSDMFPFASPLSTGSSSSSESLDSNSNYMSMGDDLDHITPTLPPEEANERLFYDLYGTLSSLGYPLIQGNAGDYGQEQTLTELTNMPLHGEGLGTSGGDIGVMSPFEMAAMDVKNSVCSGFQAGLLRMLQSETNTNNKGLDLMPLSQVHTKPEKSFINTGFPTYGQTTPKILVFSDPYIQFSFRKPG
ncbi:uncharacterized protein LOC116601137 isoform X2 [Nematostella vectensis]|uniref:uncharacterized protein LOC116601137 isoform X2 n=1 Tax=Nematostella vectensis TaxID=45351 RepID=UPI00207755B8|nr:uncharacterized protein LOC116601137 isoform X2 [Nematostella vectensis]